MCILPWWVCCCRSLGLLRRMIRAPFWRAPRMSVCSFRFGYLDFRIRRSSCWQMLLSRSIWAEFWICVWGISVYTFNATLKSGCLQLLLGSSAIESFGGSTFIDCILVKIVAEASTKTEVEALALAPAGLVQCLFGTGPAQAWMVDIHCVITYALLVLNCYRWRSWVEFFWMSPWHLCVPW